MRFLLVVAGLVCAGCGHLLVNDRLGASAAWARLDGLFPAALRTPAPLAGSLLLALGGLCALAPAV